MGDPDLALFPHIRSHLANEVGIVFWSISLTPLLFPLPPHPAPRSGVRASLGPALSHRCRAQLINSMGLRAHSFPARGRHQPELSAGGDGAGDAGSCTGRIWEAEHTLLCPIGCSPVCADEGLGAWCWSPAPNGWRWPRLPLPIAHSTREAQWYQIEPLVLEGTSGDHPVPPLCQSRATQNSSHRNASGGASMSPEKPIPSRPPQGNNHPNATAMAQQSLPAATTASITHSGSSTTCTKHRQQNPHRGNGKGKPWGTVPTASPRPHHGGAILNARQGISALVPHSFPGAPFPA